jgi:membrane metallo-endopeptidase-like protein 1
LYELKLTKVFDYLFQLDQPFIVSFDKIMRRGFNETLVRAYYDYMVKIAKGFGAEEEAAHKEMRDVIELDIAITRVSRQRHL